MDIIMKIEDTQQRTEEENYQETAQLGDDENQAISKEEGDLKELFESLVISEPTTNAIREISFQNKAQKSKELLYNYCCVPIAKRFIVLYSFLKRNRSKKVMIFFSSCNSVKYHSALLRHSEIDCFDIHGKQRQMERTSTFLDFCKAKNGILLCTDLAVRGFDIPSVDWIIQYEIPDDYKEFIYRVYRTAYREGAIDMNILIFLLPGEFQFRRELKAAKVPTSECKINENKLENVQPNLEKLVANNRYLKRLAEDAYISYIMCNSHYLKENFGVEKIDLKALAASFCVCDPLKLKRRKKGSGKLVQREDKNVRESEDN